MLEEDVDLLGERKDTLLHTGKAGYIICGTGCKMKAQGILKKQK
jgi:hypothetical protein